MALTIGMTTLVTVQPIARPRRMVFSDFAKILAMPTAVIATRFLHAAMNCIDDASRRSLAWVTPLRRMDLNDGHPGERPGGTQMIHAALTRLFASSGTKKFASDRVIFEQKGTGSPVDSLRA